MAALRDPEWLAAMPAEDHQDWQQFWDDVDALLAAMPLDVAPAPRGKDRPKSPFRRGP